MPLLDLAGLDAAGGATDANDPKAVNVGVKFTATENGYITGIRFYKGASNTGTHVGSLWTASGTLLGQVTFTNESDGRLAGGGLLRSDPGDGGHNVCRLVLRAQRPVRRYLRRHLRALPSVTRR